MYFVYILQNPKGQLYVDFTINLNSRIARHNSEDGAEYTSRNKNFILAYKEECKTLLQARRREKQIKGWRKEKKLNLIKFGKPTLD